jgi:hypothetical protein
LPAHRSRIPERFGLFTIVLGQAVIYVVSGATATHWAGGSPPRWPPWHPAGRPAVVHLVQARVQAREHLRAARAEVGERGPDLLLG